MSDRPIITHCKNCKYCGSKYASDYCEVKFKGIDNGRLAALLCRFYRTHDELAELKPLPQNVPTEERQGMTLRERVIVEAYTGYCMTTGEERDELYKYVAEKLGRPVYTHEFAYKEIHEQIQEKVRADFIALCHTGKEASGSSTEEGK